MKKKQYYYLPSSSYIQLKYHNNHQSHMFYSKFKQSFFNFISIYSYLIVIVLIFLISFFIFFHTKTAHITINHRLKRDISDSNDEQHYANMLRLMLLRRSNSSVLADCTTNMATDGIYSLPLNNSLQSEIINLIEQSFKDGINQLKIINKQMITKLNQTSTYKLENFRDDFSFDIRTLLSNSTFINEIHVRLISGDDNGKSDVAKFSRTNYATSDLNGYRKIHDHLSTDNKILQTFTTSNLYESMNKNQHYFMKNDGWWLGPVLCEKNRNETYIMARVFPLINDYYLVSYFNISSVDINQCANSDKPFGGTHKCPNEMECFHRPGKGFTLGAYDCLCNNPYNDTKLVIFNGEKFEWNTTENEILKSTRENTCQCNSKFCLVKYNRLLRTTILIIQSIFIVFVAILAAIVFERRRIKIIKHSMWILLELVLFGAALLYGSVIVDSLGPNGIVCLIIPWLRELGFTIVYGTLILRIYKMLAEFQSRKAHCVQVKEKDILRILFFISISIVGYLLGWTFVNIDHANEDLSLDQYLLGSGLTFRNKYYFRTCRPRSWDYIVQFAEFVFLCVGIRFIYSTRTAPCEYHERKLITIVIVCEMLFSTLLHIIQDCLWATIDPDALFILSFCRCHCTVTCMLLFIFCTKLCYIFRPFNEEYPGRDRFRSLPDGLEPADLVAKLQLNGDIEIGEINLRDMDPEEIRAELKRLYTSLHVLKTKTMRKDNPHLTKRHGQRRKNRRFSIQAFQRHTGGSTSVVGGAISSILGGGTDKHEHDPMKTPEDSTGSHNETTHFGGASVYRSSIDDGDDMRGRALSDTAVPPTSICQRVTFK